MIRWCDAMSAFQYAEMISVARRRLQSLQIQKTTFDEFL